jgi:hypothetical protein
LHNGVDYPGCNANGQLDSEEVWQMHDDVGGFWARDSWGKAAFWGWPSAAVVLVLFWYWYMVANRFIVFLYNHDMGPQIKSTAAFSRVTSSRYWMSGLVAGGAVMICYTGLSWLLGRLMKSAHAPAWWRVWIVAGLPVLVVVPAITVRGGSPALPRGLAAVVTATALAGLLLAFLPGELATRQPKRLMWLAADGWGLAMLLVTLPQWEDLANWLRGEYGVLFITLSLVLTAVGLLWLLSLSVLRKWRGTAVDGIAPTFLAGVLVCYLLLPFMHHTAGSDGYFYISDSDNFFARHLIWQVLAWLAALAVTGLLVRFRKSWGRG